MNRPMAIIGFSLFFTLIAVGLLGYIFAFWIFFVLLACVVALLVVKRKNASKTILAILLSAMVGCASFCTYTVFVYNRVVSHIDTKDVIKFEITRIDGESNKIYYYTAKVADAPDDSLVGAKASLSSHYPLDVEVCDYVTSTVTLRLSGSTNASSHRYYKANEIFIRANITSDYKVEKNPDKSIGYYFSSIKSGIAEIVSANLDKECAAVVNSIFLGKTDDLDYKSSMNFRNIGISHIFSVSGLHVSLISAAIFAFLSAVIERKMIMYLSTLVAMWFFVAVTGFSYSSIRAGIMLTVYYVGQMSFRGSDAINSLGVAITVICILNPYSATNVSVLYSFFATFGILIATRTDFVKRLLDRKSNLVKMTLETVVLSVAAMLFTLPIQIVMFDTATLISPLANVMTFIVIAPLMWCVIIAVILSLFTVILSELCFVVCTLIAKYLLWVSDLLASIPYATAPAGKDYIKILVFIVVAVFAVIAFLRLRGRAVKIASAVCAVIVCVSIICYNVFYKPELKVTVVDSGGTGVVITYGRSAVVIGCGGDNFSVGKIDSALRDNAIDNIDLLVLPSKETTDCCNVMDLFDRMEVNKIVLGEEYGLIESLGFEDFSVVENGTVSGGWYEISCLYTDEQRLTFVETQGRSILVVSKFSDDVAVCDEWRNSDVIVSVSEFYSYGNSEINIFCKYKNENEESAIMCYNGGGSIIIEFYDDGSINCERGE